MANLNRDQQTQKNQRNFQSQGKANQVRSPQMNDEDSEVSYNTDSSDPSVQRMQAEGRRQPQGTRSSPRDAGQDGGKRLGNRNLESDLDDVESDSELESSDRGSASSSPSRKQTPRH